MKPFLLLGFLIAAATVGAQEQKLELETPTVPYRNQPMLPPDINGKTLAPPLQWNKGVKLPAGMHRLPQDNMPCVVPHTQAIAAIPNAMAITAPALRLTKPGQIPNAAPRLKKRTEDATPFSR